MYDDTSAWRLDAASPAETDEASPLPSGWWLAPAAVAGALIVAAIVAWVVS